MEEISETRKKIYNLYLKSYRKNNNKPFREKKDFSDIQKNNKHLVCLAKIENIFKKYPAFFSQDYFDAPYKIYDDPKKYYPLDFFSSQKGVTACISYLNWLRDSDPESQFEHFKNSFKFIANFCVEKGINLYEYTKHRSVVQNDCIIHLKEHKISWYVIFAFSEFYSLLYDLPKDEFELYFGDKVDLAQMYSRYTRSPKTINYMNSLKEKVAGYIRKELQKEKEEVK